MPGANYVIEDEEEHFRLKALIKNRMVEISHLLEQTSTVVNDMRSMYAQDEDRLPPSSRK